MENLKLTSPCKGKRLIRIGINMLVTIYSLLFIMYNTLPAKPILAWVERLEVVVGGMLLIAAVYKFFACKEERAYLKPRPFIIIGIYLASRLIGWWSVGFDYSTIRTVFFEVVYLIAINEMIISKRYLRHIFAPMLILINLVLNMLEVFFHIIVKAIPESEISTLLVEHSYYHVDTKIMYLYVNPNTTGIMTALSMVLLLAIVSKPLTKTKLALISLYNIFSIAVVFKSECRSAMLALIVVAFSYFIINLLRHITGKRITILILLASLLVIAVVYGYMYTHQRTGVNFEWETNYKDLEYKLNSASSSRYNIWKTAMLAHTDKKAFGTGSSRNEMAARNEYIKGFWEHSHKGSYPFKANILGPHSGYFAMIYITGFTGFFIYISLLFYMIRRADMMKKGIWYLVVIFSLVVNHFENAFIVSKLFLCLVMMMILSAHDDEDEACD